MSSGITFFYLTGIILYLIATFFFAATIRDKYSKSKSPMAEKIGLVITIVGFISHIVYFILRWIAGGHAPVSNMFEYVTFLAISIVLAFLILYFIYRSNVLAVFTLPIALVIFAYAAMFPTDISPLVPSLQSPWLYIHVTTVSLSQGILAISFVAGLIYLIKKIDQTSLTKKSFSLEFILYVVILFVGYFAITTGFSINGYEASFEIEEGNRTITMNYRLPAITGPKDGELVTENVLEPFFNTPSWMQGKDAPVKFNTVIWSFITGSIIYLVLLAIFRRRLGAVIQPYLKRVNLSLVDEITYRSVAIGFPLFTLGGLIFASIWAQIAWDRFWGWDPKEVWALITWFFYAAFLHLRLSRGWHGEKSAWLAVIGFAIIMFNIIVVNLILAGLHSYA